MKSNLVFVLVALAAFWSMDPSDDLRSEKIVNSFWGFLANKWLGNLSLPNTYSQISRAVWTPRFFFSCYTFN